MTRFEAMDETPDMEAIRRRIAAVLARGGLLGPDRAGFRLAALSGLNNSTWRVDLADRSVVVRLPGEGGSALVDRADEMFNAAVAARAGLAPDLLFANAERGAFVFAYRPDAAPPRTSWFSQPDNLAQLGACLRRLHEGAAFRGLMDPFEKLAQYLERARSADIAWPEGASALFAAADRTRRALGFGALGLAPCHVDLVPANILVTDDRIEFVDWEYAAMSEPFWDLAYLTVEAGLGAAAARALLAGYGRSDAAAMRRLLLWRPVCRAVTVAWCLARAADPDGEGLLDYARSRLEEFAAEGGAAAVDRRLEACHAHA